MSDSTDTRCVIHDSQVDGALAAAILSELERHESQPSFNLRCKCGLIETTVSRRGDFHRHVADEMAAALTASGFVTPGQETAEPEAHP
ncbi:hypothetical protein [Pseudarthrobacter chlorophenolicus]|nr:hypothetical protein [Pseudarthrobacter chlorophenolicus]